VDDPVDLVQLYDDESARTIPTAKAEAAVPLVERIPSTAAAAVASAAAAAPAAAAATAATPAASAAAAATVAVVAAAPPLQVAAVANDIIVEGQHFFEFFKQRHLKLNLYRIGID